MKGNIKNFPYRHIFSIMYFYNKYMLQTFPNATDVVAMSNTKLSPLFAGAATHIGFVPKIP